jgi:hypothetical protein
LCPGCVGVPLFHYSDGERSYVENAEKVRFIVLEDVKGKTVTIFVEASASGFDEFLAKAQQVIKTVEWEGT